LFIALAVAYSLASPLYEPTDELRHFRYVRHLIVYRSLPVQRACTPRAQSHHPPLYYALGALVSWWVPVAQEVYYKPAENPFWGYRYWEVGSDNRNQYLHGDDELFQEGPLRGITLAVYLVRWMTVLIGASIVWMTYRIGCEIFPDRPALATGGAALVAFNPQFLYLSGAVNNDVPAALCSATMLWVCVRLVRDGPSVRTDVALGVLYGLALLTKFNLLALLALIELAYLVAVWPTRNWRAFLRGTLVVLALAALISGWWFWRNQALYGDPTGFRRVTELWGVRDPAAAWNLLRLELPMAWSTLWGRFGYGQVPLPDGVYRALAWLSIAGIIGLVLLLRRLTRHHVQSVNRHSQFVNSQFAIRNSQLLLSLVTVLLFAAVLIAYILVSPAGAMGRFFFPGMSAFALLLFLGLSQFFPRRLTWAVSLTVTVGMAALAVYALVGVLVPAFARPRPLTKAEIEAVPNPTNVEFGDVGPPPWRGDERGVARLLGYDVTPTVVEPGGMMKVTLYWQALARTDQNLAVFVHLLSEVGTMVAQRDTYPGLGKYPTTVWKPGVVFADTYRVHVPETAYAPDVGYVQVGLYLPGGPRLTTSDGNDALRLATVEVQPRPTPLLSPLEEGGRGIPNPLDANFGDQVTLIGYTLDRRVAQPGETIRLTLYWRALVPMKTNYSVFAHVLGVENQVWASNDGWPVEGDAPTSLWKPGRVIEDVRDLTIGLTTPPDFYDIEIGVYASGKGRLPVLAEDGHRLDNRVLLSKIRVVGDE
jgi:4-amino-4-deoxy-L-arabinose transferase-like glycosyltransferase